MNAKDQDPSYKAVREAGQGPVGNTNERFAAGGLSEEQAAPENAGGGTDSGVTVNDEAGGGLTGGSNDNTLEDPLQGSTVQ